VIIAEICAEWATTADTMADLPGVPLGNPSDHEFGGKYFRRTNAKYSCW
jgi:hypothetical protein